MSDKATTNWYERRVLFADKWLPIDLSDCHPGDLVRVNSSDGPGESFIYAEPPPMFDNLGAMAEPEEKPVAQRSFDPKEDIIARIQAFSPHRHGPAACPWCGELFGAHWEIQLVELKSWDWNGETEIEGDPHVVFCPRCGWLGTFVRE